MGTIKSLYHYLHFTVVLFLTFLPIAECYRRGLKIPLTFDDSILVDDSDLLNYETPEEAIRLPSNIFDNGAMPLILRTFGESLIQDLQTRPDIDHLTENQAYVIRERLRGLYSYLREHPALMSRRLQVGSRKPAFSPHEQYNLPAQKRTTGINLPEGVRYPVCPSRSEWRLIRTAHDINNTRVELFQPRDDGSDGQQWFFTVSCNRQRMLRRTLHQPLCENCCMGIDHHHYNSECVTMKSYVMALVRKSPDRDFDWNWIKVDSSCNCAISRKQQG